MNKNVLITGCSKHSKGVIDCLKKGDSSIKVFGIDCNEYNLLKEGLDGSAVAPRIDDPEYIPFVYKYCMKNSIGVIFPYITKELELMSKHKSFFERRGITVSVDSLDVLEIANDKAKFYEKFSYMMPKQIIPTTTDEAKEFITTHCKVCMKITNGCGGAGFAIIDDEKANDVTLFNKIGVNRYITQSDALKFIEYNNKQIILQEYIDGIDYSVCAMNDESDIIKCGYIGHSMVYGAVMNGEIYQSDEAYAMATEVIEQLGITTNVCFDFMLAGEDREKVYLLECNPRLNATLPFVSEAGINIPYLRYLQMLGEDIPTPPVPDYGLKLQKYYESKYYK